MIPRSRAVTPVPTTLVSAQSKGTPPVWPTMFVRGGFRQALRDAACASDSWKPEKRLNLPVEASEAPPVAESRESLSDMRLLWIAGGPPGLVGSVGGFHAGRTGVDAQLQFVQEVRWELDANGDRTGVHLRVAHASFSCSVELRSGGGEINLGSIITDGEDLPSDLRRRIEERMRRAGLSR